MLRENSPTLQRMIASVNPGSGNMNEAAPTMMPGQFQTPYPSPKDMIINSTMVPQPGMGMAGFQTPANSITMINGVPTELEYRPDQMGSPGVMTTSYINVPGAPINPDLANMAGKTEVNPIVPPPGRYMPAGNNMGYGQTMSNMLTQQPNIVGGYAPAMMTLNRVNYSNPFDVQGVVDIYDGQMIHPHTNTVWYGDPNHPFVSEAQASLHGNSFVNTMKSRFEQMFPGYSNPYMAPSFGQTTTVNPEVQDMANIAAYYGMTYNDFVINGSNMMKLMSRHANRYLGVSEEEIKKREKMYDPKAPRRIGEVPKDDSEYFYPNGAFDYRGQLTREYQAIFCVSHERLKAVKKMKVVVTINGESIECNSKRRDIDFATTQDAIDRAIINDINYRNWIATMPYRMAEQFMKAPERAIDHIEGNVFEVTSKALAFAEQKELEAKLRYQTYTRASSLFNKTDFISTIKEIRDRNKMNSQKINQEKWNALVHKVTGDKENMHPAVIAPDQYERPYICDGDWIIAKPGVDIVGLPLDQSVNKIVRMNTVTGEEEIYDPGRLTGLDVRERILESTKPNFTGIDDDELEVRLKRFKDAAFSV